MPLKKHRIRVVLNTSVIISHLYGGASRKVVDLWKHGHLQLIVSSVIVEEYFRVLRKSPLLTERGLHALQLWFSHKSKITVIRPGRHFKVCRDENDDMFLDAAYAGKAKYIISWDKDLLELEEFRGIEIVNPGQFLEIYERR
ncbi:putative toxin-antitoxin system toxin component, PIN family [Candidatus Poribacteria bacterium]|nr:putative toxin-antitoxin system toxin component, PIN family [Candidatus Poribacteria bacterium]